MTTLVHHACHILQGMIAKGDTFPVRTWRVPDASKIVTLSGHVLGGGSESRDNGKKSAIAPTGDGLVVKTFSVNVFLVGDL